MRFRLVFAALLCMIVTAHGWHDGRALMPLLPYAIAAAAHIIPISRAALAVCKDGDRHD